MNATEQKTAARDFAAYWADKGYEKGESQAFWLSLLQNVLGVAHPEQFIRFEAQVHIDHTSFIDGYIPATAVMIEQKSRGKDLRAAIRQSDGQFLTPFQQARRYCLDLPRSQYPRWIITCNFSEFLVYDMENPKGEPESILLENLPDEYYRLSFLADAENENLRREMEISIKAGELVGKIYEELLAQYKDPTNPQSLRSLNVLCVRFVFCLYAEDSGVFKINQFHDYLEKFPASQARRALIELFRVFDTKDTSRDPYLEPELAAFPYVAGGLFEDTTIEIPQLTEHLMDLLLRRASEDFDWSKISPTIFGAVFESTLNPETRRAGGMHYTSLENIHKVIDPLFLDSLRAELDGILADPVEKRRALALEAYQHKLAGLHFLDPACGSGNFLTEAYRSIRRLENEALKARFGKQMLLDVEGDIIKVSINQFHGIEINDFAVTVARAALWIAESQMMMETEEILHVNLDFLPLRSYAGVVEGNALRMDWETLREWPVDYIMGNPPFVGYSLQSEGQKNDILSLYVDEKGKPYKTAGKIDYVAGWYWKAAQYMVGKATRTALVSTNSVAQGEQVASIWKPLVERFGIGIDFGYRTFRWDSEASIKAHVHCVIIGFSCGAGNAVPACPKLIFDNDQRIPANHINPYLIDAENVWVESRAKPLCNVPEIKSGGKPVEGGFLIFSKEEKDAFLEKAPESETFFRRIVGSEEFINGKERWCLWMHLASPKELHSSMEISKRLEAVREFRLQSTKAATRECASTPWLFMEIKQPKDDYLLIPLTSSENRPYIPIGFLSKDVIASNLASYISGASMFHFGILSSSLQMAWMRTVCGRLEMRYRYSNNIVYNNFPWPDADEEAMARIAETGKAILDARALYPDCSLADLYDELTMPPELRKAHQANDRAVMAAYGFPAKWTEAEVVAALFARYRELVANSAQG